MQTFRFSFRPNRAHEIAWRGWSAETFDSAATQDRPILLCLTAVWCQWCRRLDETTFSDGEIIALANEHFVPLRVDVDRLPHVQTRYIAGGWPTTAFLTPTGEVLWAGTFVAAEELRSVAQSVLSAWRERRDEFQSEIERRRRALEAARSRPSGHGLVRREAADDVLTVIRDADDARNGGFGTAPKFPAGPAIELLYQHAARGDRDCEVIADRALDGMLAGTLFDREEGGFFRYAVSPDWTEPSYEKLLLSNAELVRAYALGTRVRHRTDWADAVVRTIAWVDGTLRVDGGLWGGSQIADADYFDLAAEARRTGVTSTDATIYTDWNAAWIGALADAAAALGREDWVATATRALDTLLASMAGPDGLLHHHRAHDEPLRLAILATDVLAAARACLAVAQASGDARWIDEAKRLASVLEQRFWADEGGFNDRVPSPDDVGALRYRERPFELNAEAARLMLDLTYATGDRKYRGHAERVLASLSPLAGRHGIGGSEFAIAVEDFFQPPLRIFLVGTVNATASLRVAALKLGTADRRVWPAAKGLRVGLVEFQTSSEAAAFVCGTRGTSAPVTDPAGLEEAVAAVI